MDADNMWMIVPVLWIVGIGLVLLFNYGAHKGNNQPVKQPPKVFYDNSDETVIF